MPWTAAIPHNNMDIVDPHLHFFNHAEGDYAWLSPHNPPFWPDKAALHKPALPHLLPAHGPVSVAGFVHIEAGFDNAHPWREIHWLNRICRRPFKAVACIDLTGNDFHPQLDALRQLPSVSGVRDILDEAAADILARPVVRHRFRALATAGLSFDAQLDMCDRNAVRQLCRLLEATPQLPVIINHAGLVPHEAEGYRQWRRNLRDVAEFPNVAIKLSGWEMLQRNWHWPFVQGVMEAVLREFDLSQVMLASNYPLCRWRMPYRQLWQGYLRLVPAPLQRALLRDNACRWYGLTPSDDNGR